MYIRAPGSVAFDPGELETIMLIKLALVLHISPNAAREIKQSDALLVFALLAAEAKR